MLHFQRWHQIAQAAFGLECFAHLFVLGLPILLAQGIGMLKQLVVEQARRSWIENRGWPPVPLSPQGRS